MPQEPRRHEQQRPSDPTAGHQCTQGKRSLDRLPHADLVAQEPARGPFTRQVIDDPELVGPRVNGRGCHHAAHAVGKVGGCQQERPPGQRPAPGERVRRIGIDPHGRGFRRQPDQLLPDRVGKIKGMHMLVPVSPDGLELRGVAGDLPLIRPPAPAHADIELLVVRRNARRRLVGTAVEEEGVPPVIGHQPELGVVDPVPASHDPDPDVQEAFTDQPGEDREPGIGAGIGALAKPGEQVGGERSGVATTHQGRRILGRERLVHHQPDCRARSVIRRVGQPPEEGTESGDRRRQDAAGEVRALAVVRPRHGKRRRVQVGHHLP